MAEGSSWLIDAEIAVKADNLSAVGDAAEVEASRIGDLLKDLGGASKEADARSILSAYDSQISQSIRQLEGLGKGIKVDETVNRLRTLLNTLVRDVAQQFNVAFEDLSRGVEEGGLKLGGTARRGGGGRGGGGREGGGEKEVIRGGGEQSHTKHADVVAPIPLPREARPLSALQLAQERARMQPAVSGGLRADTAAVSALSGSVKPTVSEQKQVVDKAVAQVVPSVARERVRGMLGSDFNHPTYTDIPSPAAAVNAAAERQGREAQARQQAALQMASQSHIDWNMPQRAWRSAQRLNQTLGGGRDGGGGSERGSVMPSALFPGAGRVLDSLQAFQNRQTSRRNQVETSMYDLQRGIASGEVDSEPMRSGSQGTVRKVTYRDGTVAAVKTTPDTAQGHETVTKEVLSGLVAQAIGPNVAPAAAAIDRRTVASEFVPGRHLWTPRGTELSDAINSPSGRGIGLLDTLIGNNDRNPANWLLGQNGPRGIDHGLASFGTLMGHRIGISEFEEANSGLLRGTHPFPQMPDIFTPGYGPNQYVRSDLEKVAPRLASLRPQFEAHGSGSWLDSAQGILRSLTEHSRSSGGISGGRGDETGSLNVGAIGASLRDTLRKVGGVFGSTFGIGGGYGGGTAASGGGSDAAFGSDEWMADPERGAINLGGGQRRSQRLRQLRQAAAARAAAAQQPVTFADLIPDGPPPRPTKENPDENGGFYDDKNGYHLNGRYAPPPAGSGGGGIYKPPTSGGSGDDADKPEKTPAERATAHVQGLKNAAELLEALGENGDYLAARLRLVIAAAEDAAEVFTHLADDTTGAAQAQAGGDQAKLNFKNKAKLDRLTNPDPDDIQLAGQAAAADQINRQAINDAAGTRQRSAANIQSQRVQRANDMGVVVHDPTTGAVIPNAQLNPQRLQTAVGAYNRLEGKGFSTSGMNLAEVEESLKQLGVEARAASRAEALLTSSAGGGERKGFWKELMGASVSGAGGYRSASRLPPGALAGNALGALGRGAVGGIAFNAFFALQGGLQMALSSAMALDKQMAELKDTIQGVSGNTDSFKMVRDSILSISEATGVAGTGVAELAQLFIGFTGNALSAVAATKSVAEYIAVTGESAATAGPQFETIMANFAGLTAQQSGNAAVTAGRAVGRTPQEIQAGVAELAPVASQFGLTANQTYGLVAAVSKNSAFSGSDIGQGLGRIMENLPDQITAIERESNIKFTDPSNMQTDLKDLLSSGKFNYAVTQTLGGAHNANLLAAAQQNPAAMQLLGGDYTNNNALANRNAAVQATLAESFAHLREQVEAFGSKLIDSGIGEMFTNIIQSGADIIQFFGTLAGYIGSLNNKLDGAPARVAEFLLVLGGLNRLGAFQAAGKALSGARDLNVGSAGRRILTGAESFGKSVGGAFANPTQRAAAASAAESERLSTQLTQLTVRLDEAGGATTSAGAAIARQIEVVEDQIVANDALTESSKRAAVATEEQAGANDLTGGLGGGGKKAIVSDAEKVGAGGIAAGEGTLLGFGPVGWAAIAATAGAGIISAVASHQTAVGQATQAAAQSQLADATPQQLNDIIAGKTVKIDGKTITPADAQTPQGWVTPFEPQVLTGKGSFWDKLGKVFTGPLYQDEPWGTSVALSSDATIAANQKLQNAYYGGKGVVNPDAVSALEQDTALVGLDPKAEAALTKADTAFGKKPDAATWAALQAAQTALTKPGSLGATDVQTAKDAAARTAALQSASNTAGVQFQSTGDVTTAFQGGLINSTQAIAALNTVIKSDNETTQAGIAAKRADQAALAQFTDQLTSSRLANQIAVGTEIGGASPAAALALTQASVTTPGITAGQASTNAYASVAAQAALSQYDIQNAQSLGGPGQTTGSLIAGQVASLTQGNAPVSYASAVAANTAALKNDPSLTAAQLPYPSVGIPFSTDAYNKRLGQQEIQDGVVGSTNPAAIQAEAEKQLAAQGIKPGANDSTAAQYAKLTLPEKVSQISQIASEMQAKDATALGVAQNAGDDANTLAQMKVADDQKTLAAIHSADQAAGVSDDTSPAYIQAMQQYQDDVYSKLTTELSNLQTLGNLNKSKDFMSAIAQAQDDVNTAEKMRGALTGKEAGMSWAGLQAEADAGTISTAGEQALGQHDAGIQSTYQAGIGQIQGMSQVAQSMDFKDPRQQAQDQINSATKQAQFAGTSIGVLQQQYQAGTITTAGLAILNQYTSGQQSAYQANMSQIQGVASVQKGMDFQNPAAQAQDDIKSAQQQASAAGTSIAALQAQFANGTINSAGLAILNQYVSAQQEVFQAVATTAQAQVALLQSQDIGNPLAQAQDAITGLVEQIDKQYGSVAKLQQAAKNPANVDAVNTLAQLNQANYAAFQAQQANIQGKYTAQEATATAVGNTPKAADEALAAAKQALSAFTKKFPKDANLNNSAYSALYANWQTAQGNALSATISYGTNLLQEEVANNQISIGQEIAGLKALQAKARKAGNNAEVEALQTQIQQAINQGNANASFDLPAGLNIPTLYEARRSEGTRAGGMAGGGTNYYGNTGQVNVNININGNTDTTAAVNRISQAVGGSPTTGNNLPPY